MGVSEPAGVAVCAGLELIRHAERLRNSRALHDQVGPSLCSAGLMVSLLRSSAADYPQTARELMETIQDSLEAAIDAVRALSYGADPALAHRCGLRGALEFLSRAHKAQLDLQAGLPDWPVPQAETACRILQDALLVLPAGAAPASLRGGTGSLEFSCAGALPAEAGTALASLAAASGLRLDWLDTGEATCFTLHAEEAQ